MLGVVFVQFPLNQGLQWQHPLKNVITGARSDITVLREIHLYSCDKKCTVNGHFSYPSVHSICSYSYNNFKPLTHILHIRAGQDTLFIYHTGNRLLHQPDVLQKGVGFGERFSEGLKDKRETKPVSQDSTVLAGNELHTCAKPETLLFKTGTLTHFHFVQTME